MKTLQYIKNNNATIKSMKKYGIRFEDYEKINECETFGGFLANLRKYYKLTQPQLAEKLNINYKAISKWENDTNFPDVGIHKSICDFFNITLDEFYSGKIDIEFRKKSARSKNIKKILTIVFSILLPSVFLFVNFLWKNYDTLTLYSISRDEKSTNIDLNGLFIDYQDTKLLYIGNIELLEYELKEEDIISVELIYKDKVFYTANTLNKIYVAIENNNIKDINELFIKVKLIDEGIVIYEEQMNLKFYREKLNNYKTEKSTNSKKKKKNIKSKLLKDGFKETSKNIFIKTTNKKGTKTSITIMIDSKRIIYTEDDGHISKSINFNGDTNVLDVQIVQIHDNIRTIIEKYDYYYNNKELSCHTKSCLSYKDV